MVGVEHDSATMRFEFEDAGDNARQQKRTQTLVDDRQLGDGRVQPDVVGDQPDTAWRWNPLPLCTLRRIRRPGHACCRRTVANSCRRAAHAGICAASAPPAKRTPTFRPDAACSSTGRSCRRRRPDRRDEARTARSVSAWAAAGRCGLRRKARRSAPAAGSGRLQSCRAASLPEYARRVSAPFTDAHRPALLVVGAALFARWRALIDRRPVGRRRLVSDLQPPSARRRPLPSGRDRAMRVAG